MKAIVANMNGIMAYFGEQAGYLRRESIVDDEFHTRRGTASSRSIADRGEAQTLANVFYIEVWIVE